MAKRELAADAPYGEYGRTATEVLTPEGIVLPFINATFGERLGALVLDILFITVLSAIPIIIGLVLFFSIPDHQAFEKAHKTTEGTLEVAYFFYRFFLESGYFMFFEAGPWAATPGKRLMRLRVIAHDGGRLTPAAVFTRNAMREIETNMPVRIVAVSLVLHNALGWLAFFWGLALILLPLFNRQHARLGDYLAGTRVVHMPKAALGYDLADLEGDRNLGLGFTPEQLAYGEMELGVLEQVLREKKPSVMKAVADKIKARIGWQAPKNPNDMPSDEAFLRAYYGALRAWLEGKMLLGKRRKDKNDPALT